MTIGQFAVIMMFCSLMICVTLIGCTQIISAELIKLKDETVNIGASVFGTRYWIENLYYDWRANR